MKKAFLVFGALFFMTFFLFSGESHALSEDPCAIAQSYLKEVSRIYQEYLKSPGEMSPVFLHHSIQRYVKLSTFCTQQAFFFSIEMRALFAFHRVTLWLPEKKTIFKSDIEAVTEILELFKRLPSFSVMDWPNEKIMDTMKYILDRSDSLANIEVEIEAGF